MDIVLLFARLLLAAVFAVAGLAKLLDRARSQQNLVSFGLPTRLAAPFAVLVPMAELVAAGALVPTAVAWWGAVAALGLLLLFSAAIVVNLAQGKRPDCHCFGQLAARPVGWPTLIRNGALAGVAGFVVWQGQEDAGAGVAWWLADLTMAEGIALLNVTIAAGFGAAALWLLVQLLAQNGRLLLRLEALEERLNDDDAPEEPNARGARPVRAPGRKVGTRAPLFALTDLEGQVQTLEGLVAAGRPVLLTFTDPNCGPCDALLPELATWQRNLAQALTLVAITRGSRKVNRAKTARHRLANVLVQTDREVAELYGAHGTPGAVLVRADGTVGSPVAQGVEAIRALVERAVGMPARDEDRAAEPPAGRARGLPVGSTAPPFELPDVHGRRHALSQWRGRRLALIFFDPRCSFCVQMAPRLARLPSEAAAGMPVPLVIAAGSAEENRRLLEKHGIRCLVLLQERTEVAWAYGAHGTPTGCLVDEHGAIASELASGAQAVLAMTGLSAGDVGTAPEGQEQADSDARLHLAPNGPRP